MRKHTVPIAQVVNTSFTFISQGLTNSHCSMGHLLLPNWLEIAKKKRYYKVSPEQEKEQQEQEQEQLTNS